MVRHGRSIVGTSQAPRVFETSQLEDGRSHEAECDVRALALTFRAMHPQRAVTRMISPSIVLRIVADDSTAEAGRGPIPP